MNVITLSKNKGVQRRKSASPSFTPVRKVDISRGVKTSAGPSGSVDWRTATRPSASFFTSTQAPPASSLHGLHQPRAPRSRDGMPLRMWWCTSDLLAHRTEEGLGLLGGRRLGAQPVQGLAVHHDVVSLVEVDGADQTVEVDDVGQFARP